MSIFLIDTLKPKNNGVFPILEDIDLKGGFRVVSNNTARDAINTLNRTLGMWVWVESTSTLYKLSGGITNANWVVVTLSGGGGGTPGGSSTQAQFNVSGSFAGSDKLTLSAGEITHSGAPIHKESEATFLMPILEAYGYAKSLWRVGFGGTLATIEVPIAGWGDGHFTVTYDGTYDAQDTPGTGGNVLYKAVFKRRSGIMTRLNSVNMSSESLQSVDPQVDINLVDNDTISVISANLDLLFFGSLHVQFAKKFA